jgi:uncharacterized protein YbjT (DUF2867 family)
MKTEQMSAEKWVLVTGATGFIGRATVSALTGGGWTVTKASRSSGVNTARDTVNVDLADASTILALAKGSRFDAIALYRHSLRKEQVAWRTITQSLPMTRSFREASIEIRNGDRR